MVFLGRGFLRAQHVACVCRLLSILFSKGGIFLLMFPFVNFGIAVSRNDKVEEIRGFQNFGVYGAPPVSRGMFNRFI